MTLLPLPDGLDASAPAVWIATWFGAGLVDPLRAGLAVASVFALALTFRVSSRGIWLGLLLGTTIAGSWASGVWETATGISDNRLIVIDEVAGYAAVLAVIGGSGCRVSGMAALLFLALDRLKPWPFDRIEAVPGGIGVMLDDIALGFALGGAMLLVRQVLHPCRKIARPAD
ncbi:MAG: phosphatidylglycerophosphatase A [Rhizobiaceae bacterium]|nr:phosphatidylglycerophosphatase A [Rhizobiaceae bacterium]